MVLERADEVASLVSRFFIGREPVADEAGAVTLPRQAGAPAGRT